MKEAKIIFPVNLETSDAVDSAMKNIIDTWGGATSVISTGYWRNPTDPTNKIHMEVVKAVEIAYEPSDEMDAKLYDIAWQFREAAKQVEVYLRYGNGHVQMVTEKSCMDNGHGHFDLSFGGMIEAMNTLTDPGQSQADRMSAFEYLESSLIDRRAA